MTPFKVSDTLLRCQTSGLTRFSVLVPLGLIENQGIVYELPETHKPYFDANMLNRLKVFYKSIQDKSNIKIDVLINELIYCDQTDFTKSEDFQSHDTRIITEGEHDIHLKTNLKFHSVMTAEGQKFYIADIYQSILLINGNIAGYYSIKSKIVDFSIIKSHSRKLAKIMYLGYLVSTLTCQSDLHKQINIPPVGCR